MDPEPTSRWIGFDPVRLAELARRTGQAVEHLTALTSDDPAAAAAAAAIVAGIRHDLSTRWLPVLARVAVDESMTSWTATGPEEPTPADRVAFLLGTALGRMYGDVIDVAADGDLGELDGYPSSADIDRAAVDPERVRELVAEWGRQHGIELDDETVEFLTGEIVGTASAMSTVDDEPWNAIHGSIAAVARDEMFAVVVVVQAPAVALDLVAIAADPQLAARWWAALTITEQAELGATSPALVGAVTGLPADVRDEANRAALATDLAGTDPDVRRNAEHVAAYLAEAALHVDPRTGEPVTVQLYVYEPAAFAGEGRVAVAIGDVDSADHVAVTVPGLGGNVAHMAPAEALRIYDESRWATGSDDGSVAVVDWMGYDAPSFEYAGAELAAGDLAGLVDPLGDAVGVIGQGAARDGARRLAREVAGIDALRQAGVGPAHVTVVGHSYGSTTVATAAADFGLAADDLVLTGSPGAGSAGSAGRSHDR